MRIEKVSEKDAKALLDIYAPYVRDTAISFEYDVPTIEDFTGRIKKISAKYPYIKAVDDDGTIIGYAYAGELKGRAAYDWSVEVTVYVDKSRKMQGTGRMLYAELEKRLSEMGVTNLYACIAFTETPDEHLTNDSMLFHEKMGYELIGTFHKCGYKFNTWYDMIWMEKITGEHESNAKPVEFGNN